MKPKGVFRNQGPYVSTWGGSFDPQQLGCYEGWRRYDHNPLVHTNYGWIGSPCVLRHAGRYYLYAGWDGQNKVALMLSEDGFSWERPVMGLFPQIWDAWEEEIGAPCVVVAEGAFHMWYTASSGAYDADATPQKHIVHASSENGLDWLRDERFCLKADMPWEKHAVQHPCVVFEDGVFRMWYTGGGYETGDAIGYAESHDGVNWQKCGGNPVFTHDPNFRWEHLAVGAAQVMRNDRELYMAYTAYEHLTHGRICFARSQDGLHWTRHPGNPIITGGNLGFWDVNYVSTPWMLREGDRWRMWYTGHRGIEKNIGLILHEGVDLGFGRGPHA